MYADLQESLNKVKLKKKKMLDGQGYYTFNDNYNSQVLSLNKVLKDSKLRNKIFFKKLEIE